MILHGSRELAKSLVKVVHLCHNANCSDNHEDVCRWMRKLIFARKSQLQCNAECLHRHHRNRSDGRANGDEHQRILPAISGRNLVDHDSGENTHYQAVKQESYSGVRNEAMSASKGSYLAESHSAESRRQSQYQHLEAREAQ